MCSSPAGIPFPTCAADPARMADNNLTGAENTLTSAATGSDLEGREGYQDKPRWLDGWPISAAAGVRCEGCPVGVTAAVKTHAQLARRGQTSSR